MPEKAVRLGRVLQKLENFVATDEGSELILHLIRKDLFDLIHSLSPLSRTRKLVSEILDLTEECPIAKQNEIREFIFSAKAIYKIQESEDMIRIGRPAGQTG